MVYCQKCGTKNDDDAKFCKNCSSSLIGAPIPGTKRDYEKEWEDKCDEECAARGRSAPAFWGIIVLLIGMLILIEVLRNIEGLDLPQWFYDFNFWWIIGLVIALAIIFAGIKMLMRKD